MLRHARKLQRLVSSAHGSHEPVLTRLQYTATASVSSKLQNGPTLADFINTVSSDGQQPATLANAAATPYAAPADPWREPSGNAPTTRKLAYVQTLGCQMNVSDSEVVLSILRDAGYDQTQELTAADVVLVNTCAIREGAEQRIWSWLGNTRRTLYGDASQWRRAQRQQHSRPVVGVLGCMAERLKGRLLDTEKLVDLVAGPDAYRDLPRLIDAVQGSGRDGQRSTAMNVQLSLEETYADVVPLRPADATSAFLSIMRGCNNMCAFCIVPHTRGRERSRTMASILDEVKMLSDEGVKEVTLLGQNVNSYADWSMAEADGSRRQPVDDPEAVYAKGFSSVYKPRRSGAVTFAELLARVAEVDPEMRVRFTSPHPKDFSDEVLQVIAGTPNVCSQLHMPAQSGSSTMLQRMRRGYTREAYDELVAHVRDSIPHVALSTDIIAGFCGETEEEHAATVDLMRRTRFDNAFMFAYSQRDRTPAARHLADDVPEEVKSARLQEIIATYREGLSESMAAEVGRRHLVLVQGQSKRDADSLTGRTDTMKRVIFPDAPMPAAYTAAHASGQLRLDQAASGSVGSWVRAQPGDYIAVEILSASAGTLLARPLARTSLLEFVMLHGSAVPPATSSVATNEQPLCAAVA